MKEKLVDVKVRISGNLEDYFKNEFIALELNLIISNNVYSEIRISEIRVMLDCNFFPDSLDREYCNIYIKSKDTFRYNSLLLDFINKYGIHRLFFVRVYTNIGIFRSASTSIYETLKPLFFP